MYINMLHIKYKMTSGVVMCLAAVAHEREDTDKKLNKMTEKLIGRGINGVEDCVDTRAASYISSVRERFKLDNCERVTTTVVSLDHEDVDRRI